MSSVAFSSMEPSGSYSIVIEKAEPDGVGPWPSNLSNSRKKLTEEGLFSGSVEASSATISKKDQGHHQSKQGRDSRYYRNGEPTLPWC